jgi:hypothetical protein
MLQRIPTIMAPVIYLPLGQLTIAGIYWLSLPSPAEACLVRLLDDIRVVLLQASTFALGSYIIVDRTLQNDNILAFWAVIISAALVGPYSCFPSLGFLLTVT